MGLRELSGYVAYLLLALYWVWVLSRTAPQLRKGPRGRGLRVRVLLVRTAGAILTALLVGAIYFWATQLWHLAVAVVATVAVGLLLHRYYRGLVLAPHHRFTLVSRVRAIRVADPDSAGMPRIVLLPAGPVDEELPPAAAEPPAPEPGPGADSALMVLDTRRTAFWSTWTPAAQALPEPGGPGS